MVLIHVSLVAIERHHITVVGQLPRTMTTRKFVVPRPRRGALFAAGRQIDTIAEVLKY